MAKKHNWVTGPNNKVVDRNANRLALQFICGCNHLTPAAEEELDNLLNQIAPKVSKSEQTVCEPDMEVLASFEANENDWLDVVEPGAEAFEYDMV